jgi:ATP-dependent protease HslVU (ClpYQ) peptidase subunit
MACDTQRTYDETKFFGAIKIRAGANSVMGIAGASRFSHCAFAWWQSVEEYVATDVHEWHLQRQLLAEDIIMLVAHKEQGIFRLDCTGRATQLHEKYAALGTGAPIAYGALAMGATATQALDCAMKYDLYTGGEIDHVSLPG